MKYDEKEFFREATLRICGSLEVEKALWDCLNYLGNFMPAVRMSFHIHDRIERCMETVAFANPSGSVALSIKTFLSDRALERIEKSEPPLAAKIVDRLMDDPLTSALCKDLRGWGVSGMILHLTLEDRILGVLSITNDGDRPFSEEHAKLLGSLRQPFAVALMNILRFREVVGLKDLLADDKRYFQEELRRASGDEIIGGEFGLRRVMEMARQVSRLSSPVLLLGETGVGKEVIATAIHTMSDRRDRPFIKVNCGAIPETLIDSELFGHEKGAFTGALSLRRGRFERADGGTLFLDEIGELPADAQVRLLRVLQEKEIERVGGSGPIKVNIRVIAATHRDLEAMIGEGRFREDLYFRLNVFPIVIPPLRERLMDFPALLQYLMVKKSRELGFSGVPTPAAGAVERLTSYHWPGNVRELENVVERALILSGGGPLSFDELIGRGDRCPAAPVSRENGEDMRLDSVVSSHIRKVLRMTGGRVEGKNGAARILDVNPGTLRHRMRKLGIAFGRAAGNLRY